MHSDIDVPIQVCNGDAFNRFFAPTDTYTFNLWQYLNTG